LERWFGPAEAIARARHFVESGQAWNFPAGTLTREAAPIQGELFGGAA
jgi:hypothetical protein